MGTQSPNAPPACAAGDTEVVVSMTARFGGALLAVALVAGILISTSSTRRRPWGSETGLGTTFKVYLSRSDETVAVVREDSPARPRHPTETILLVEDEPAFRGALRETLEEDGYTVALLRRCREGLDTP